MSDQCSNCDGRLVRFVVPDSLVTYAPGETAAICATCLDVTGVETAGADGTAEVDETTTGDGTTAGDETATGDSDGTTDTTTGTDTPREDPAFDAIHEQFPTSEGGVAFALLIGTLPSVTLRRDDAVALREYAERSGVDTRLAFDRLIDASERGSLAPAFDLSRRVRSFESLADGA